MLEIRGLKVSYGPVQAVRGVSLSARSGEVTCIVGPNGAGKSSTMLAAAGALRATGEVMLSGQPILNLPAHEIARRGLSLVPEGRGVFATLTVRENLGLAIRTSSSRSEIDVVCDRFPLLRERLNMYAGHLSGGEQQQLVIARALLTRPKLLLIDEPSLGLSPRMIELVVESILQFRRRRRGAGRRTKGRTRSFDGRHDLRDAQRTHYVPDGARGYRFRRRPSIRVFRRSAFMNGLQYALDALSLGGL